MAGSQRFFTQIEPNWPLPYSIPCQYHGWGMPGRRAGSPIAVYARAQCREPNRGQQKVHLYCEDDSLFLSSYYLSTVCLRSKVVEFGPVHRGVGQNVGDSIRWRSFSQPQNVETWIFQGLNMSKHQNVKPSICRSLNMPKLEYKEAVISTSKWFNMSKSHYVETAKCRSLNT